MVSFKLYQTSVVNFAILLVLSATVPPQTVKNAKMFQVFYISITTMNV